MICPSSSTRCGPNDTVAKILQRFTRLEGA